MSTNDNEIILNFLEKGTFPSDTVLYFDPPLVDNEMYELKRILDSKNIEDSNVVLYPIEQAHFYTRYPKGNQLAWVQIYKNRVDGWQNVIDDSPIGSLDNKASYIAWYERHDRDLLSNTKFINGRKLLTQIDTFDLFDQLNESDDKEWFEELDKPQIDSKSLSRLGDYRLKRLTIEDLKPGIIIKRRSGKFIYELGEELPLYFLDWNTKEKLNGELGFMLINLSNGKRYAGRKHQIVRDFYLIELDKPINESEEDEFKWAKEIVKDIKTELTINDPPPPPYSTIQFEDYHLGIRTGVVIPLPFERMNDTSTYMVKLDGFGGWPCSLEINGLEGSCYFVDNTKKVKILEVPKNITENEEKEWYEEVIQEDNFPLGVVRNHLDDGDVISVTGNLNSEEGETLTILNDNKFIVKKSFNGKMFFKWLEPIGQRPKNWEYSTLMSKDWIVMGNETLEYDDKLLVKIIKREEHPF